MCKERIYLAKEVASLDHADFLSLARFGWLLCAERSILGLGVSGDAKCASNVISERGKGMSFGMSLLGRLWSMVAHMCIRSLPYCILDVG